MSAVPSRGGSRKGCPANRGARDRPSRALAPPQAQPDMPQKPDRDARERLLIGYGEVMSIVQLWEQALTVVWLRTQRKNPSRPSGDFDTPRSQKEIMRLEAAFLRMTAQSVRKAISPHLEPKTADDLSELMSERNRLAHRFLRERAADDRDFKLGTHDQLIALGNRFMASLESVMRTIEGFEPYKGPVPEHWNGLAERITELVFGGQAIPRDPGLQ
jgi:hypothetical protein